MTASPPGTVGEIEVFRLMCRMSRLMVEANTRGITHEESLFQPQPAGNCLNWMIGHLMTAYEGTLPLLGQQPVLGKDAVSRYARRGPPLTDPAEAMDFGRLMRAWAEASDRIDAGLAALDPDQLDQPSPFSPTGNPDETYRSLLATVSFHQAYHAGQAGVLRRLIGKEGAVR
jgi:hypothetical protein